jgi:hypothetical protein
MRHLISSVFRFHALRIISENVINQLADGQSAHHTMVHVRYQEDVTTT